MTPTESTVRRLAAALYPGREVWAVHVPRRRATIERYYILCGTTLHGHCTLGDGTTADGAWASAEARCRREIADAIARERRDRDRAQAEIERLTAALERLTAALEVER